MNVSDKNTIWCFFLGHCSSHKGQLLAQDTLVTTALSQQTARWYLKSNLWLFYKPTKVTHHLDPPLHRYLRSVDPISVHHTVHTVSVQLSCFYICFPSCMTRARRNSCVPMSANDVKTFTVTARMSEIKRINIASSTVLKNPSVSECCSIRVRLPWPATIIGWLFYCGLGVQLYGGGPAASYCALFCCLT